jgi:hypothetical protein
VNDSFAVQLKYKKLSAPPALTTSSTKATRLFGMTAHSQGFESRSSSLA